MEIKLKGGWVAFFVIVIIAAFLGLIVYSVGVSVRECNDNSGCNNGYCGSDFKCHTLSETKISNPNDLDYQFYTALILIALLIIISNIIYRVKK